MARSSSASRRHSNRVTSLYRRYLPHPHSSAITTNRRFHPVVYCGEVRSVYRDGAVLPERPGSSLR
jgi:hypothetical protein